MLLTESFITGKDGKGGTPSFLVYKAQTDTTRSSKLYFDHYTSYIILFVVMNI
jgi:hypothetical protein